MKRRKAIQFLLILTALMYIPPEKENPYVKFIRELKENGLWDKITNIQYGGHVIK